MIAATRELTPHVKRVLDTRPTYRHETEVSRVAKLMAKGVRLADIKTHLGYDALREARKVADACILLGKV